MPDEFDFIVIGAGSSGCVVANRLSGKEGCSVLVLEAGGRSDSLLHRLPFAATKLWFNPKTSWGLWSEPEPGLDGRRIPVPRGKGLGGSSAINGTVYNRGSPSDYDQWTNLGLNGWNYASLLPYFRRIEDHWRGADARHGAGGEVPISPLRAPSRLSPFMFGAARQMGWPVTDDLMGEAPDGVGMSDLNVDRRGRRSSAFDAFLAPLRGRRNLTVETHAHVRNILVENGRAVGVTYTRHGQRHVVRARREVILSGGSIASPEIMLRSGIGPAEELRRLGIAPVHDLPGVGRNLNDQPGGSFEVRCRQPLTSTYDLRIDRFVLSMARWALGMGGIGAGPPMVMVGSLRTLSDQKTPDLRVTVTGATMLSKVWCPGIGTKPDYRFMVSFALAHPRSRGAVTLASPDPAIPPKILYNLLTDREDVEHLRRGYRLLQEFIRQPALSEIAGEILRPDSDLSSDAEIDRYLRTVCGTTSHPMGSCRMGVDEGSVVDGECRVRGLEGLRVVDASVFPTQISGNPHSAAMMLGDRVSDMILSRAPLAAAVLS